MPTSCEEHCFEVFKEFRDDPINEGMWIDVRRLGANEAYFTCKKCSKRSTWIIYHA